MDHRDDTNRDLLIGLLALQNGLVEQDVLILAFRAWTRDKSRPIAELLAAQGAIDAGERGLLEGLAAKHLHRHGGDAEKSLAAIKPGRSLRDDLAQIGDPDIEATLGPARGSADTEGRAEAERAVAGVRRAVDAGFARLAWIRSGDPDLKPIRSRPDFQLLMMDLTFPADPFAHDN